MSTVKQDERERIMSQIKALQSLSNSPNPHEAASAASKAQQLIAKYQVTMAELERDEAPELNLPVGHKFVRVQGVVRTEWVCTLASAIARANLCSVLYSKHAVMFIGREDNVDLASYMFNNLHVQLVNLVREAVRQHTRECKAQGIDVTYGHNYHQIYRRSWLYGAALEIGRALNNGSDDFESSNDGMAIVSVNDARIKAYMQLTFPRIRSFGMGHISANGDGIAAGRKAGAQMKVQGALESTRTSTLRLGSGG